MNRIGKHVYDEQVVCLLDELRMRREFSALIGIVGGIVDLAAGIALLQAPPSMRPMNPGAMIGLSANVSVGYFLLALGVIVLLTGLYMFSMRMMQHSLILSILMILYGLIMLVLGVGMIRQMFFMMQGSMLSGSVMIVLGVAMLYSGGNMARK